MLTREELIYLFRLMRNDALPERAPDRPCPSDPSGQTGQTGQTGFTFPASRLIGAGTAPLPPKPVSKIP